VKSEDSDDVNPINIAKFVKKMDEISSEYFDMQSILNLSNKIDNLIQIQKELIREKEEDDPYR
jgi:hypothetical protein